MSTQPLDHGILSGTRRTSTPRQRRHDDARIERSIDAALAEVKAEQEVAQAEARAAYAKRNTPVPFTMDQLKPGGIIRTSVGLPGGGRVSALGNIHESLSVETYTAAEEHHRNIALRLLAALDAVEDQLRWFDAAIANNPDVKVSARVAARRIRTAVNDALEADK